MILLIDNYDCFSYNLYQLVGVVNPDIQVIRNDELTVSEIEANQPSAVILSPGPGHPRDAGICEELVRRFAGKMPILGVCLGHQAIGEAFGGVVAYGKKLMHGKPSQISLLQSCPLFAGLPAVIQGARYHSLAIERETLPPELTVTAQSEDGEIMAVQHKIYPVYGLQFHPESVLTPLGGEIIKNFLREGDYHND